MYCLFCLAKFYNKLIKYSNFKRVVILVLVRYLVTHDGIFQKLAPTWKELGKNLENQKTMHLSKGDYTIRKYIFKFLELIGCCPTTLIFVENEVYISNESF